MILLGQARATAPIAAPLSAIDLGEWMFTLTSDEYAACAEGHQSAAQGWLPSGLRVSMNAETVGGQFMVQHYVEEIAERDHVRGVSPNTVLWISDEVFVLAKITWDLQVNAGPEGSLLTCTVTAETENAAFAAQVEEINRGIPFEDRAFQKHVDEETPLFALDIARKAQAGVWGSVERMTPEIAAQMLEQLYNHGDASLLRRLAVPNLRHFSRAIGDGVAAWERYAARYHGERPLIAVHRTVRSGDRIALHAHYRWNPARELDHGPGVAVAHIFTLENERIVEAIELTQPVREETVSGHDMFSMVGPTVPAGDPEHQRMVAERVVTEFLAGNTALRDELLGDYIQHNPVIPAGKEGIAGFIDMLGGNPNDFQWSIADGDLAWTYTRYTSTANGMPPFVTVDIWHFDENGRVAEHWDVLEPDFTSPDGHAFPG